MSTYQSIQPDATDRTDTVIERTMAKRIRDHLREQRREREAHVRQLINAIEDAYVEGREHDVERCLSDLHWTLRTDERIVDALAPGAEDLDPIQQVRFHEYARDRGRFQAQREAGENPDRPLLPTLQELSTYVDLAKAMGMLHSVTDKTRYAPVYMEYLDQQGVRSTVREDERSPIGRRRVGASTAADLEDMAIEVPHADCEHILLVADPRQGKDSTAVRFAGNLKDEHGYKWVSLYDDGRNETPAISIPNDETAIRENLEEFGLDPKAYKSRVWVPAVGAPDELPANHEVFTVGVETLTPELIGQLAGIPTKGDSSRRIKAALDEVRASGGSVDELIRKLEQYADETSAQITVTELKDEDEVDEASVESTQRTYQMGEDDYLRECAQTLLMLASEGLLRDAGADTNLDMRAILEQQDTVAVLNSNYLPSGLGYLKYLLMNLWAQLIFQLKEEGQEGGETSGADLPRVALECRELKMLAPSKPRDHPYPDQAKRLGQTMFEIASQGGSRRILLLGSTQYINDVYKAIRGNMPIKILLKSDEEKLRTIESAGYQFSDDARWFVTRDCDQGWGLYIGHDGKKWPIQWCGARCGLGLGDVPLRVRYGWSMGFRVHYSEVDVEPTWEHEAEVYVDVDGRVQPAPPDKNEWYLLLDDLDRSALDVAAGVFEERTNDVIDADQLDEALEERRDYPLPEDLRPASTPSISEQRHLEFIATDQVREEKKEEVLANYTVRGELKQWLDEDRERIERLVDIIRAITDHEIETYSDIEALTGIPTSTIGDDMKGPLADVVAKQGGVYELEPIGVEALSVEWGRVLDALELE